MSLYDVARGLFKGICKILFRIEVVGLENVPKEVSFVICSNHKSNFDPIAIAVVLPIKLNFMAKEELFRFKPLGYLLHSLRAFPVKRGKSDIGALKAAMSVLKNEGRLLIFPEGTRAKGEYLEEGKGGAALIAVKSSVNILPIGIKGRFKLFSRVKINIGEMIDLSENFGQRVDSEKINGIVDNKLMPTLSKLSEMPIRKRVENFNS